MSSGPLGYGIVERLDVQDSRLHNFPRHWNGAPSQQLLVIRRNHETDQVPANYDPSIVEPIELAGTG